MTVYQYGYTCPVHGKVKAKIAWSNDENDVVAMCPTCGMVLQRVIPQPFSTPLVAHTLGQLRGGPGQPTLTPVKPAPAKLTQEAKQ